MRVLVTGGGGFAGRHLIRELLRKRYDEVFTTGLDLPAVPPSDPIATVRWLPMDLASEESIQEVVSVSRPDLVFHLAGQASVGQSFQNPLQTWDTNATGTLRLLTALGALPPGQCRMLLISSAEVYGDVPASQQPIGEEAPVRPVTPYGSSKAAAEIVALQAALADKVGVVVARSFNHIGPGQDERFILPSMANQLCRMTKSESVGVLNVGNLAVERDFLDVRDVARAYVLLAEKGIPGTVYNVASGQGVSLLDLVQNLVELSGTGARIQVDNERVRPVDIPKLVGDSRRLQALGWQPEIPMQVTLGDLLLEAEGRL